MVILQAIQDFGNWFWGIPILILIGGGGLFLTIYLGFPQIRHFGYAMSQTFGKMFAKKEEGKVRPISAAFAALACAVGASNIVGVPVAIALGGPGAVFWIWILAIFGMCTKYCEVAMGIKYRRKNDVGEWVGGPAYYLRGLGKKIGVVFGVGYAFFFMIELVPSLASQGVSAAEQFNVFGANQTVTGIIIAVLVGVILAGGFKRVSSVTDILVPVMACLYVLGALVIIFAHVGELPAIFGMIFQDAFTGRAAVGGFAGATVMAAIRWGAARGVYSNEAGVGSTIAGHCTADTDHPIRQAQFGIFEVFMDTIVICTITALAVLASGVWTQEGLSSGQLALAAFQSVFGNFGAIFVAITVFMFVFSTIISAGFFGQIQAEILFGRKFSKIWVFMYPLFIGIACAFSNVTTMYMITDGFMAIIVILNMIGLLLMCKQVKDLQKEYYNTPGILMAKCLCQLIQGFSRNISAEDLLYKLRLCFLYDDLTQSHLVAKGLLPVSHHRIVLSMDSRSSSPFFRQKRTESLLSMIIFSTSSPNSSASKLSRNSGPPFKRSIKSRVCRAVISLSASISFSFSCLACRSCLVSSLVLAIKMSGSTRPCCLRKANV